MSLTVFLADGAYFRSSSCRSCFVKSSPVLSSSHVSTQSWLFVGSVSEGSQSAAVRIFRKQQARQASLQCNWRCSARRISGMLKQHTLDTLCASLRPQALQDRRGSGVAQRGWEQVARTLFLKLLELVVLLQRRRLSLLCIVRLCRLSVRLRRGHAVSAAPPSGVSKLEFGTLTSVALIHLADCLSRRRLQSCKSIMTLQPRLLKCVPSNLQFSQSAWEGNWTWYSVLIVCDLWHPPKAAESTSGLLLGGLMTRGVSP